MFDFNAYYNRYEGKDAKMAQAIKDGYRLVNSDGGGVVSWTFWHPVTKDSFSLIVADVDYDYDSSMIGVIHIDNEVRNQWLDYIGVIRAGVTARVVKGRKFPINSVVYVRKLENKYVNYQSIAYAVLGNGRSIALENLVLELEQKAEDTTVTEKQAKYIESICKKKKITFPQVNSKESASQWISENK